MTNRITRPNWYDFKTVSLEDMNDEQSSYMSNVAKTNSASLGDGVLRTSPSEPVLFDSSSLTLAQSGYISTNTFDGRGILDAAYSSSDADEGTQISVEVSDALLDGVLTMTVTLIGKTFDDDLIYEHLTFTNNGTRVSKNSFKEVTNVLFQNFQGNSNTSVDGYGSWDVGGTVVISEAGSMKPSLDLIAAEQVNEPDIIFRDFKTYDSGKTLTTALEEAIGASNDVSTLGITTTSTSTRSFAAAASTDLIYGQKFKMKGDNIQKATLLLSLSSGSTWSGDLVVEVRPLQTSVDCPTDFLPANEVEFDPDTVPLASLSLDQSDLEERGIVLTSTAQPVDFVLSATNLASPTLSNLVDGEYYVLTIRRTGSTATGTIVLEEATNTNTLEQRLTVYQSNSWTDVEDSSLWFQVWSDSVKVANGVAYDQGTRISTTKTYTDNNGVLVQKIIEDIPLVNTSEGSENYLVVRKELVYSDTESHPRTGDQVFSKEADAPSFDVLSQSDVVTLLTTEDSLNVLARIKDNNPKANPQITDTLDYPGLALNNTIDIIDPSTDFLTQNVVGSIITPNTAKPAIRYRIIKQETFTDLYGDMDSDEDIDINDANRVNELDGYAPDLSSGTVAAADQLAYLLAGETTIAEILRGDVNADGYIDSQDFDEVTGFITDGYALTAGSSFTRVRLTVEPLTDPASYLDGYAASSLQLEVEDADLIDNVTFSTINLQVDFIPTWDAQNVELLDLRRYTNFSFTDFSASDIQNSPESGGQNNHYVSGDLYLGGSVLEEDGTHHPLDFEQNVIEFELPEGNTEGRLNVFDLYVSGKMYFSDGTLVSSEAITNNQVRFETAISSYSKNLDGYDFDGYGTDVEEAIATYMDHDTGLLRMRCYNVVKNELYPELRTRIQVSVSLKKAGFRDSPVYVESTDLATLLDPIS